MGFDLREAGTRPLFQRTRPALAIGRRSPVSRAFAPHAPGHQELLVVSPAGKDGTGLRSSARRWRPPQQPMPRWAWLAHRPRPACPARARHVLRVSRRRLPNAAPGCRNARFFRPPAGCSRVPQNRAAAAGVARDPRDGIGKALRPLLVALDLFPIGAQAPCRRLAADAGRRPSRQASSRSSALTKAQRRKQPRRSPRRPGAGHPRDTPPGACGTPPLAKIDFGHHAEHAAKPFSLQRMGRPVPPVCAFHCAPHLRPMGVARQARGAPAPGTWKARGGGRAPARPIRPALAARPAARQSRRPAWRRRPGSGPAAGTPRPSPAANGVLLESGNRLIQRLRRRPAGASCQLGAPFGHADVRQRVAMQRAQFRRTRVAMRRAVSRSLRPDPLRSCACPSGHDIGEASRPRVLDARADGVEHRQAHWDVS